MEFQQNEEISEIIYDVIMDSLVHPAGLDGPVTGVKGLLGADKMNSSMNSPLDDTTPSDSGVQLLDSELSEMMVESITSQTGFDFEDGRTGAAVASQRAKEIMTSEREDDGEELPVVDTNSNVTASEDAMTTSACSTFDTAESIVYRRKVRKQAVDAKAPKKRVSFHEDILKNTRTDNIHIEHGFITYKQGRKAGPLAGGNAGRYSWCPDREKVAPGEPTELCPQSQEPDETESAEDRRRRRVVYRNACSDVLDYGNSDVYDTNEGKRLQYDNSGVFEYLPKEQKNGGKLYQCSCSSSDSSLDSNEQDKNSNRPQYEQAKSSSCDCIGMSNANNNNFIDDNCYFSEPSNLNNELKQQQPKSVWNKEKQPKSSCLKKTKRYTNVIAEQDLSTKVKKFNVHDMNQLLDNSKMIFGSLKSIFTIPLPERGVPEGSEDLQPVVECVPELEQTPEHRTHQSGTNAESSTANSPPLKPKPFLSKSLDGSKKQSGVKKFVHNVDEQLRRNNAEDVYAVSRQSSDEQKSAMAGQNKKQLQQQLQRQEEVEFEGEAIDPPVICSSVKAENGSNQFRNKFIINCESTVFEHTGVSYEVASRDANDLTPGQGTSETATAIGRPERSFMAAPIAKTFSNFFRSFKETPNESASEEMKKRSEENRVASENFLASKMLRKPETPQQIPAAKIVEKETWKNLPTTSSSSTISDLTHSSSGSAPLKSLTPVGASSLVIGHDIRGNLDKQSRHLPSPLKKRSIAPQRFGSSCDQSPHAPDLFGAGYSVARGGCGRDSKSTILSEDFDDILTVTTETDKNDGSDIVILDYPEIGDRPTVADYANLLKPPQSQLQPPAAKTSLINRFLRNVTQKKILETSLRRNNFFAEKLKNEQKLFGGQLYVPGAKLKNFELIDDLNAEIAMEIEMSGVNSPRRELVNIGESADMLPGDMSRFEMGIGEISTEIFNGNYSHILRDASEQLLKVFKLYTGYSREGHMTPVLVFLTDKTLYVTDLVRSRLCSQFVLAYRDLDVILMGPFGNTVLLSNSARDMQQVLLAGGPYPAAGLVANLELCARRGGSALPAVGQLTLEHLAPLQAFVRANSSVANNDSWVYYAVVNVPATGALCSEQEPLGPHEKGFLMHRRIREHQANGHVKQCWNPGYFLLKAGVLYMFNDSHQKLPSWAMALAECQGARRSMKAGRPHCFEIVLKGHQLLQLAAPDEYVASEWLQALLQSASGLFEMQEKHKTLGCSLVVTRHHLITLREDFSAPLRRLSCSEGTPNEKHQASSQHKINSDSVINSATSTPTKCTQRSSSVNSTPTHRSQLSRSSITGNTLSSPASLATTAVTFDSSSPEANERYSHMCSVYGRNSGVEVLSCADIKDLTGIKIPSHNDTWWCILEFSCQEVRETSDDLIIFFASSSEMQRFLRLLEQLWQAKNNDLFPITVLDEEEAIAEQCTMLYMDINRSWEPLLSAALGYPL